MLLCENRGSILARKKMPQNYYPDRVPPKYQLGRMGSGLAMPHHSRYDGIQQVPSSSMRNLLKRKFPVPNQGKPPMATNPVTNLDPTRVGENKNLQRSLNRQKLGSGRMTEAAKERRRMQDVPSTVTPSAMAPAAPSAMASAAPPAPATPLTWEGLFSGDPSGNGSLYSYDADPYAAAPRSPGVNENMVGGSNVPSYNTAVPNAPGVSQMPGGSYSVGAPINDAPLSNADPLRRETGIASTGPRGYRDPTKMASVGTMMGPNDKPIPISPHMGRDNPEKFAKYQGERRARRAAALARRMDPYQREQQRIARQQSIQNNVAGTMQNWATDALNMGRIYGGGWNPGGPIGGRRGQGRGDFMSMLAARDPAAFASIVNGNQRAQADAYGRGLEAEKLGIGYRALEQENARAADQERIENLRALAGNPDPAISGPAIQQLAGQSNITTPPLEPVTGESTVLPGGEMNSARFTREIRGLFDAPNPPQNAEEAKARMKEKGWTDTQIQDWIEANGTSMLRPLGDLWNWLTDRDPAEIARERRPYGVLSGSQRLDEATPPAAMPSMPPPTTPPAAMPSVPSPTTPPAAMPVPPRPKRRPTREETQRQLGRNWDAYS